MTNAWHKQVDEHMQDIDWGGVIDDLEQHHLEVIMQANDMARGMASQMLEGLPISADHRLAVQGVLLPRIMGGTDLPEDILASYISRSVKGPDHEI